MNAKDMLDLLRDNINEASESFWTDVNLMRRLNNAQSKIAVRVAQTPGQWLLKSASVAPVDSVITLPADCAKPIYLEQTSDGVPISWLQSVAYRRVSRAVGTMLDSSGVREAYPLRLTLEVNVANYTTVLTLWYQIRVPDLVAGTAATGGAASLTLPDDRISKRIVDYYNNVTFEPTGGTGDAVVDTITAYTNARVATVTGTYDATTIFGTISILPPELHNLITLEATISALNKPSAQIDKEARQYYAQELRDERKTAYAWLESRTPEQAYVTTGDAY